MVKTLHKALARRPRLTGFACLALALLFVVWTLSPAQLPIVLHKLSLVTLAGVVGYWLDRHAFPGEIGKHLAAAATDARILQLVAAAYIRRAIIMGATTIAVAIAL